MRKNLFLVLAGLLSLLGSGLLGPGATASGPQSVTYRATVALPSPPDHCNVGVIPPGVDCPLPNPTLPTLSMQTRFQFVYGEAINPPWAYVKLADLTALPVVFKVWEENGGRSQVCREACDVALIDYKCSPSVCTWYPQVSILVSIDPADITINELNSNVGAFPTQGQIFVTFHW